MQVHCDEGVAPHIGPKPGAGIREDVGEASAGERAGQPLSRDRKLIPGADTVCVVEGNMPKTQLEQVAGKSLICRGTEGQFSDLVQYCRGTFTVITT